MTLINFSFMDIPLRFSEGRHSKRNAPSIARDARSQSDPTQDKAQSPECASGDSRGPSEEIKR